MVVKSYIVSKFQNAEHIGFPVLGKVRWSSSRFERSQGVFQRIMAPLPETNQKLQWFELAHACGLKNKMWTWLASVCCMHTNLLVNKRCARMERCISALATHDSAHHPSHFIRWLNLWILNKSYVHREHRNIIEIRRSPPSSSVWKVARIPSSFLLASSQHPATHPAHHPPSQPPESMN